MMKNKLIITFLSIMIIGGLYLSYYPSIKSDSEYAIQYQIKMTNDGYYIVQHKKPSQLFWRTESNIFHINYKWDSEDDAKKYIRDKIRKIVPQKKIIEYNKHPYIYDVTYDGKVVVKETRFQESTR